MAEELIGLYARLHAHCAGKRLAVEMRIHRERVFKARGRVFAFMNSPGGPAVTVQVRRATRKRLLRDPAIARAHWIGWLGWLTVRVHDEPTLALARRLIDESHALAIRRARS
jgi:predicted DNA-binding protein (MmcQ/YjbR family)